jgi:hypothetical protein
LHPSPLASHPPKTKAKCQLTFAPGTKKKEKFRTFRGDGIRPVFA